MAFRSPRIMISNCTAHFICSIVSLGLVLTLGCGRARSQTTELLQNGDFEQGSAGEFPKAWYFTPPYPKAGFSATLTDSHSKQGRLFVEMTGVREPTAPRSSMHDGLPFFAAARHLVPAAPQMHL